MYLFFALSLSLLLFSLFLCLTGLLLGSKNKESMEGLSAFECGFLSWESARLPFSLQFFLMSVIFLIFDMELIILFPFLMGSMNGGPLNSSVACFFLFISASTLYEWAQKGLEWAH